MCCFRGALLTACHCWTDVGRCYFIAQTYLSVKKYKEVLALYERTLDYAQQSLESYKNNMHDNKSKARMCFSSAWQFDMVVVRS